jgi:hypothetical protein
MAETKLFVKFSAKMTDLEVLEDSCLLDVTLGESDTDSIKMQIFSDILDTGSPALQWTNNDKRKRIKLLSVTSLGDFERA